MIQYAYLCWPPDKVLPESTESIIDLISRVLSLQSDHQEAGPIILHSRFLLIFFREVSNSLDKIFLSEDFLFIYNEQFDKINKEIIVPSILSLI